MKHRLFFLVVLSLTLIFVLNSCKKKDNTFPVITLIGDQIIFVSLNGEFHDPGATAYDETDGEVYVESSGDVNTNLAGTYYIIYMATDKAGNVANASRVVIVSNEAASYNGTYHAKVYIGSDSTFYNSSVVASNTINLRIWIAGFSTEPNAVVYADILNDSINVPIQYTDYMNPLGIHKFYGTGKIIKAGETDIFEIFFSDSVQGNIKQGKIIYVEEN